MAAVEQDVGMARGGYITTYSGIKFYPLNPNPFDVSIYDIAHALSNCCRWGGHIKTFHSLAQHCYNVSMLCEPDPEEALIGLLHDAAEAYLGDMIRPVKYLPEMSMYKVIETRVEWAISAAFRLKSVGKTEVTEIADQIMLAKEAVNLRLHVPEWAQQTLDKYSEIQFGKPGHHVPTNKTWENWSPDDAYAMFMARFDSLYKRING